MASSGWMTWPNHGLPRGTPSLANEGYVKIFWGPGDSNPEPPPHYAFALTLRPAYHYMLLVMEATGFVCNLVCCVFRRGVGLGLSPGPRSFRCYVTMILLYARNGWRARG
jgi:hypothetical protein